MSQNSGLAPAGSSTYDSNTLHVGDGTWDSQRDSFLLPNLLGLNFATMRYNGMGNRFAGMPNYHRLIAGHGVLAAITFLFIVPASVFLMHFYRAPPFVKVRINNWLQILTVFLTTVILVLGVFSVGPERSLSNPHHGIGVAIYVLVLFQIIWGWLVRKLEKNRQNWRLSIKMLLYQWISNATALLALAQIALGLTLYGSPKSLFILYALWVFVLLVAWFVFSYQYQSQPHQGETIIHEQSEYTDQLPPAEEQQHHHHHKATGLLGALAAGGLIAWIAGKFRKHHEQQEDEDRITDYSDHQSHHTGRPSHSHYGSQSQLHSEYTTESGHSHEKSKDHTWRDRLIKGAGFAAIGGIAAGLFRNRKKKEEEEKLQQQQQQQYASQSNVGYSDYSYDSRTDMSRMEEGRPPPPTTPAGGRINPNGPPPIPVAMATPSRNSRAHNRRSGGSIYSSEEQSYVQNQAQTQEYAPSPGVEKRKSHGIRDSIAAMGLGGYLMSQFRGKRKEDQRVEELRRRDEEAERIQRQNSLGRQQQRYTGDDRSSRPDSLYADSRITTPPHSRPGMSHSGAAIAAGGAALGAGLGAGFGRHHRTHSALSGGPGESIHSSDHPNTQHPLASGTLPPPRPQFAQTQNSSMDTYDSTDVNRRQRQDGFSTTAAAVAAGAAGLGAGAALGAGSEDRRPSTASPVYMKLHSSETPQGKQQISIRRLTDEEAARMRTNQPASASASSFGRSGDERWRRSESGPSGARPIPNSGQASQASQAFQSSQAVGFAPESSGHLAPPNNPSQSFAPQPNYQQPYSNTPSSPPQYNSPPPPATSHGVPGSVTAGSGIGPAASVADSKAESNRRRRRAERARQQQQRGSGSRVNFADY